MGEQKPTNARAVSTDALETLGKIHTRVEKRDAIHLAVEPVECGEDLLEPGAHIAVKAGIATSAYPHSREALGIVDPFLPDAVRRGQRFWFVMYPRAVHSLRHVWTHPSFPDADADEQPADQPSPEHAEARAWLEALAARLGFTYDRLMEYAAMWLGSGEYIMDNTERYKGTFDSDTFWKNYDIVTGKVTPANERECFFTCSC